jgi:hypothetical protein
MSWWNLGGLNPKFKEFMEKHPDKTVVGVSWALVWRLWLLCFACEIAVIIAFALLAFIFVALFSH